MSLHTTNLHATTQGLYDFRHTLEVRVTFLRDLARGVR
jgi:hypothetical protein